MVSSLDLSVRAVGLAVRETEFGEVLRRSQASGVPDQLQSVELSFDPAIHRTFAAISFMSLLQEPIPSEARNWTEWNVSAIKAIQRIAAKCWTGVSSDFRKTFLDQDDLPPIASNSYISNLRQDKPGVAASRFGGLNADSVRDALSRMYTEIASTRTAVGAREAAVSIERNPHALQDLMSVREGVQKRLREYPPDATIAEVNEYMRTVVDDAYTNSEHLGDVVTALRNHNRFVHWILWAVLGTAESVADVRVTSTKGAVVEQLIDGERQISFTVEQGEAAFLRTTHPVWFELGSPLDGLYWVQRHTLAFAGGQQNDLTVVAYS